MLRSEAMVSAGHLESAHGGRTMHHTSWRDQAPATCRLLFNFPFVHAGVNVGWHNGSKYSGLDGDGVASFNDSVQAVMPEQTRSLSSGLKMAGMPSWLPSVFLPKGIREESEDAGSLGTRATGGENDLDFQVVEAYSEEIVKFLI